MQPHFVAAAAPSSSGWDPSGHGTDISLSTTTVTNDTATLNAATLNMVRGTASKTTGKFAFEVKVILAQAGAVMFGLMDQTTSGGASMTGVFNVPDDMLQWNIGTLLTTGADFSGTNVASWTPVDGDIYGVQADLTGGKVWFSRNGASLGGDPVAGTGNTGSIANNHLVCPAAVEVAASGQVFQLLTGTLNFPISGFSSWG